MLDENEDARTARFVHTLVPKGSRTRLRLVPIVGLGRLLWVLIGSGIR